jgi:hypothetical protein
MAPTKRWFCQLIIIDATAHLPAGRQSFSERVPVSRSITVPRKPADTFRAVAG